MSHLAQLLAHIKALKLSGIAESLELRLKEAQSNDLNFSEFLAMILTDELQVRSNRKLQRLLLRAHAESSKTLESFDFGFAPGVKATQIRELSTCPLCLY